MLDWQIPQKPPRSYQNSSYSRFHKKRSYDEDASSGKSSPKWTKTANAYTSNVVQITTDNVKNGESNLERTPPTKNYKTVENAVSIRNLRRQRNVNIVFKCLIDRILIVAHRRRCLRQRFSNRVFTAVRVLSVIPIFTDLPKPQLAPTNRRENPESRTVDPV